MPAEMPPDEVSLLLLKCASDAASVTVGNPLSFDPDDEASQIKAVVVCAEQDVQK